MAPSVHVTKNTTSDWTAEKKPCNHLLNQWVLNGSGCFATFRIVLKRLSLLRWRRRRHVNNQRALWLSCWDQNTTVTLATLSHVHSISRNFRLELCHSGVAGNQCHISHFYSRLKVLDLQSTKWGPSRTHLALTTTKKDEGMHILMFNAYWFRCYPTNFFRHFMMSSHVIPRILGHFVIQPSTCSANCPAMPKTCPFQCHNIKRSGVRAPRKFKM